tara:strand:- start:234 stop:551 length:318 start_codon:yes stop_codon:yes gene_type:complete
MPKHKPEIYSGPDFFDLLFHEEQPAGRGDWDERELADALGVPFVEGEGVKCEAIIIGWWVVTWPEHVLTTSTLNRDATYAGPFGHRIEAMDYVADLTRQRGPIRV